LELKALMFSGHSITLPDLNIKKKPTRYALPAGMLPGSWNGKETIMKKAGYD
jgi:hypothetical protein